jgi:hypothetical protein
MFMSAVFAMDDGTTQRWRLADSDGTDEFYLLF